MCSRQEQVFGSASDATMYDADMSAPPIDHRHLRSALEYAIAIAREGRKFKPPMKSPKALDKYLKVARLPTTSLAAIRRTLEADEAFRTRIAVGALPELVDPIGRLWLERPIGWEQEIERLVAEAAAEAAAIDAANELKHAEKRRAGGRNRADPIASRSGDAAGEHRRAKRVDRGPPSRRHETSGVRR